MTQPATVQMPTMNIDAILEWNCAATWRERLEDENTAYRIAQLAHELVVFFNHNGGGMIGAGDVWNAARKMLCETREGKRLREWLLEFGRKHSWDSRSMARDAANDPRLADPAILAARLQ